MHGLDALDAEINRDAEAGPAEHEICSCGDFSFNLIGLPGAQALDFRAGAPNSFDGSMHGLFDDDAFHDFTGSFLGLAGIRKPATVP